MPRLTATIDMAPTMRRFRAATPLVRAHTRRRLSYWGRQIIKYIRRDHKLFRYANGGATGKLKASLRTRRGRSIGGDIVQEMSWGVPYGEVLEFGPRRKFTWKIRPKGFRSDVTHGRSGGGVALKFLRFQVGAKIVYAKEVKHVWTTSQLRPHFEPHMKKHERGFLDDMGSITQRVLEGRLR